MLAASVAGDSQSIFALSRQSISEVTRFSDLIVVSSSLSVGTLGTTHQYRDCVLARPT